MSRHIIAITTTALLLCSNPLFAKGHFKKRYYKKRGGATVFQYTFMAENRLQLKRIKVHLGVRATVAPAAIKSTLATLKSLSFANAKPLTVEQLSQNKTSTGLINIRASLSGVLPIARLQAAYQLAKTNSRSGMMIRVDQVQPFFPLSLQQNQRQKLSLKMYAQAQQFARQLAQTSGQPFRIAKINFSQNQPSSSPGQFAAARQYTLALNKVSDAAASLPLLKTIRLHANVVLKARKNKWGTQWRHPQNGTQTHTGQAQSPQSQPAHRYPEQMH